MSSKLKVGDLVSIEKIGVNPLVVVDAIDIIDGVKEKWVYAHLYNREFFLFRFELKHVLNEPSKAGYAAYTNFKEMDTEFKIKKENVWRIHQDHEIDYLRRIGSKKIERFTRM